MGVSRKMTCYFVHGLNNYLVNIMGNKQDNDVFKGDGILDGDVKFVQKAVVFKPGSEMFLTMQRPSDRSMYEGPWDLPGGKADYGEDHLTAIRREICEESGLDVSVPQVRCLDTFMNEERGIYYIFAGYSCQAEHVDVQLSAEHLAYQWVSAEDFLRLPSTPFLQKLVREVFPE